MVRKNKVRYELIGGKPYNRQVIGIYPTKQLAIRAKKEIQKKKNWYAKNYGWSTYNLRIRIKKSYY
ncbi:MAG: hypothetical protein ACTSQG_10610 [Promethearchaeota archaeon]